MESEFYFQSDISNTIMKFKNCFGNRFEFLPLANENEINQFEKKFSIKIPEDFKWFLLNIANGIKSKTKLDHDIIEKIDFKNFFYEELKYNPSIPFNLENDFNYNTNKTKDFNNGYISLLSDGGQFYFLVVNGKEYGFVWNNNYISMDEVTPEYDNENNKLNFSQWIILQIEERIKKMPYRNFKNL